MASNFVLFWLWNFAFKRRTKPFSYYLSKEFLSQKKLYPKALYSFNWKKKMSEWKGKAIASSSTSSKGKSKSSLRIAPTLMSVDQYATDVRFTLITHSRARSTEIQLGSTTKSLTPPPRPSTFLVRPPSSGVTQLRSHASPSSKQGSSIPSTSTSS